jgi:hypothetical protein
MMRINRNSVIIIVLIMVIGGVYLYQSYFNQVEPVYTLEYDDLFNYSYYRNYGNDQYLVDSWTLRYYHTNWTESVIWYEYGPFSVVFEAPENDMTLQLSGIQVTPDELDFVFPLTIYQGGAYYVELEPYWSENVSCRNLPEINLGSSGTYTIILTGVAYPGGHRYSLRHGDDDFETVEVYVYFQLVDQSGHVSKFKIDNRIWGARTKPR